MHWLRRLPLDPFVAAIAAALLIATVLPARGPVATVAATATTAAVALLFFLHGARLRPSEAWAGASHWRLHVVVLCATFALFPGYGLLAGLLPGALLEPQLHQGLLFLCAVPSTVQSAIVLTSIARGNVPAAIFSATLSSTLGIVLTPLLVSVTMTAVAGVELSLRTVGDIALRLFLPFAAGQLLRPWIGGWMARHQRLLGLADQGSILLVVYTAFSASVVGGVWSRVAGQDLAALLLVEVVLLTAVLGSLMAATRLLRFARADRVAIAFGGTTKSAAAGVPMATVLFPTATAGLLVLPLLIFHQTQLIAGTLLARQWRRSPAASTNGDDDDPAGDGGTTPEHHR